MLKNGLYYFWANKQMLKKACQRLRLTELSDGIEKVIKKRIWIESLGTE